MRIEVCRQVLGERKPAAEWSTGEWRVRPPFRPMGPPQVRRETVVTRESGQPVREALKTPLPGVAAGCYGIGADGCPSAGALRTIGWRSGRDAQRERLKGPERLPPHIGPRLPLR